MIVNEAESKVMCFGKQPQFSVIFNNKEIEQVEVGVGGGATLANSKALSLEGDW